MRVLLANSPEFTVTDDTVGALAQRHPSYEFVVEGTPSDVPGYEVMVGWPAPDRLQDARLRWVQIPSVGIDRYLPEGFPDHVSVTNGRGVFSQAIAEHALALLLGLTREIKRHSLQTERRQWHKIPGAIELAGSRVLVVGTGEIGRAFARTIRGFDCTVVGASRSGRPQPEFGEVIRSTEVGAIVAGFDVVVLALPRTSSTRGLWSRELIGAMKPGSYLVNVGRGDSVDEPALISGLQSGRIAGAGLDVTEHEPLPTGSPLWGEANVIISSHSSGFTPNRMANFLELLDDNLARFESGDGLRNIVDPSLGY